MNLSNQKLKKKNVQGKYKQGSHRYKNKILLKMQTEKYK